MTSPGDSGRTAARDSRYDDVLDLATREFSDLPLEAVFKEDLLRLGVHFTPAALRVAANTKTKSYFIFSFDMTPLAELPAGAAAGAPEEIALAGGPHALRRTIVSVRLNPASPYRVDADDGGDADNAAGTSSRCDGEHDTRVPTLGLWSGDQRICDVLLGPYPEAYRRELPGGKTMREVAPTIEWGYLIYLTVFRLCQYFGAEEECRFCDINENFRQQRRAGRPYQQVKPLEDVLAALEIIDATEREARERAAAREAATAPRDAPHPPATTEAAATVTGAAPAAGAPVLPLLPTQAYTITGGSITSTLQGQDEVDFYCRYAEAIEQRFPGRWISKVVVQAHEADAVRRFKDAGVRIYHPNYEVWDARLFGILCAGKQRHVGRDTWIRRILDATKVFGPEHVIPNFVAGIEMARPHGFATIDEALRSTGEGLDFFMSHGVVPRFTTWCPEPLSVLGRDQGPAPLAYHLGLLRLWRDTHRKHRLPPPPGYGEPGPGRAVFSVSAFMDVVEPR